MHKCMNVVAFSCGGVTVLSGVDACAVAIYVLVLIFLKHQLQIL